MRSKKVISLFIVIFSLSSVLVTIGNGCSQSVTNIAHELSLGSQSTLSIVDSAAESTDIEVIPGAPTVSIVNTKQIVEQLSSCVGLETVSESTLAMYEQKKGAVSITGVANTVTAPMTLAILSVAGEVCNDLITKEVMQSRFFTSWNLAGNNIPSDSVIADSLTKFALSCWQKKESIDEQKALLEMISTSIVNGEDKAARKSALMLCTAVLSSLDAITY